MNVRLPILSIETSQSNCGACVYFSESNFIEMNVHLKNVHAEKIFEIIDTVIKSSKISIHDLGVVAVSSGPGSFTGLRIGMSAAKGIAYGANLPIIAVPTFEAFALQISKSLKDGSEFIIANKVNSDEIYFAKFQVKANNYIFVRDLEIIKSDYELDDGSLIFGNAIFNNSKNYFVGKIDSPKPEYVANWAENLGINNLFYEFDYLEPNYLKNFIVKEK